MEATPIVCDGLPFTRYMLAGAVAGMTEHVAMFPVDTVKTRMQVDPRLLQSHGVGQYSTVGRAVAEILKQEGARGMYRGVGAMALGAGPAHAVYFACYEKVKRVLNGGGGAIHPLAAGTAGATATIVSDAVALPMDVVKQRLQLPKGSGYLGVWNCVTRILKEEGFHAFFRSYPTTLLMNIPYTAIHFSVYESAKEMLGGDSEELEESFWTHLGAGGLAGASAAAATTPLDVVKTRMQTECAFRTPDALCTKSLEKCVVGGSLVGNEHPTIIKCMKNISAMEGPRGLIKGLVPRIMFHAPAAAICWTSYEAMKAFLSK
mmetsp:Transcript_31353/g.43498  ORF Transcript_31353/g.43498 Transcript_31353/m.43498 type:complete len:318 (-) Transcript_31353:12-965(-)